MAGRSQMKGESQTQSEHAGYRTWDNRNAVLIDFPATPPRTPRGDITTRSRTLLAGLAMVVFVVACGGCKFAATVNHVCRCTPRAGLDRA